MTLRGRPRPARREGARAADAELPARRGRRARGDLDHRVGHRHPAGQHADRRARRHVRPQPALPDPRAGRPQPRARLRVPALSERGGADARGGAAALRRCRDYTELGAGFKVAMRDLELRGAGNLLGDEQSGHVAALGLRALHADARRGRPRAGRARATGRGRASPSASTSTSTPTCPPTTSPTSRPRSTSTAASPARYEVAELEALRDELEDRFGPVPEPLENLICPPAGADQARPGRRPRGLVRGDRLAVTPVELDSRPRQEAPRGDPGGAVRVRASRRSRCASPTTPSSASRRSSAPRTSSWR